MQALSSARCEACDAHAKPATAQEVNHYMPQLPGWQVIRHDGIDKLSQTFKTQGYTRSMSFTNAVAKLAESSDHHPQMIVDYGAVTVIWWSHKIAGLHKNDFIMAAKTSEVF